MMTKNKYNKVLGLALAALTLTACSDTWDDHYDKSATELTNGMQEGSLWQAIKQNSNLSNFASVVEACGFDKSLASSQVFTVFAPTNDKFSATEASQLIAEYNAEVGKVNDDENTVLKEFLRNHIALYNHSVSPNTNDTIVMMNGKYVQLTQDKVGDTPIASGNTLYSNGVLFIVDGKVDYSPNVFEYIRKDADLDSLSSFLYNSRFYRNEFDASSSVAGGFVDGKTVYLDSVFSQVNDLFGYDFLKANLSREDSTYWMVAPTDTEWQKLITEYSTYFNYDNTVPFRDSLVYTNPRLAIVQGTIFSRTLNTDAALADSAFSTNADNYTMRTYDWGLNNLHYYQFGDGLGYSQVKPFGQYGPFYGTQNVQCSNGVVMKSNNWNINPLNTFNRMIIVEAESNIKEGSKVKNTSTGEDEETIIPTPRSVNSDNEYYGKVWNNSFVEFRPTRSTVNHTVTFNIRNVLSNVGYDIYLVAAPYLATDSNAVEAQRLPTKLRCTIGYHNQQGNAQTQILQSSISTTPDIVDYLLLAEDYKFPCSSYGLTEDEPQVTLTVETRVSSTEQRNATFTRTMCIDCILLVPHGTSKVEEDRFLFTPHGDGAELYLLKK